MALWVWAWELRIDYESGGCEMSPVDIRGSAYGVFSTIYGFAWFIGSFTLGILYDFSLTLMVVFSLFAQIFAVRTLTLIRKYRP